MTTLRSAAEMALEALEYGHFAVADQAPHAGVMAYLEATDKLRTALAEPTGKQSLQVEPQRKPLTDDEIHDCFQQSGTTRLETRRLIARAIERAHGIGSEE